MKNQSKNISCHNLIYRKQIKETLELREKIGTLNGEIQQSRDILDKNSQTLKELKDEIKDLDKKYKVTKSLIHSLITNVQKYLVTSSEDHKSNNNADKEISKILNEEVYDISIIDNCFDQICLEWINKATINSFDVSISALLYSILI